MRVLGIDPGTVVTGYGVIDGGEDEIALVDCGALVMKERSPIGERLYFLYGRLNEIVRRYSPEAMAIEQPFVARNVKSALAIGRAQAVAILTAAGHKIPVFEYTPAQIKQSVASYGASSKEQIQQMVRLELGMSEIPDPPDVADALAVAICHLHEIHFKELISNNLEAK